MMRDIEQDRKTLVSCGAIVAKDIAIAYMDEVETRRTVMGVLEQENQLLMAEVERLAAPKPREPQPLGIPGPCIECGYTMEKCWDYGCGHTE